MSKVILNLEGMSCASCALTIEKALKKAKGVKNAVVNFVAEKATIEGDRLDAESLIKAVKNVGYSASVEKVEDVNQERNQESKRTYDVIGMSCASCAATIEKVLKKTPGVKDASVNIATEKATVVIDTNVVSEREMAKAVKNAGYELIITKAKHTYSVDDYGRKVKVAKLKMIYGWIITGPLSIAMILDMFSIAHIPYFNWISLVLAFPVIFVIGYNPIRSGVTAVIHRSTNMDTLILLGVLASYVTGILSIFGMQVADYSAVGAMIMGFYLIGQYLEIQAKGKASEAIKKLLTMGAKTAHIIDEDGNAQEIPADSLAVGDIMLVKPSEQIPTDGVVIDGETTIDESMVTGEFAPVRRTINDKVIGSTINQVGVIRVRVTNVGEDTFLSQVVKLVEEAQGTKVPIQAFADKVVSIFVPSVLFVAFLTFMIWLLMPQTTHSIMQWGSGFLPWVNPHLNVVSAAIFASVATLVIACPCALGLATPTALMVGSGMGASRGILIRSGKALQTAKDVNTVVFDKTGTITSGKPHVTDVKSNIDENALLNIVGSLENYSEHPLGKAIVKYAKSKGVKLDDVDNVIVHPGLGIEGMFHGRKVSIGNIGFIQKYIKDIPLEVQEYGREAKTITLAYDEKRGYLGVIALSDTIKENAANAINQLKAIGIKTVMLTGDNEFAAKTIAKAVGIDEVRYNLLPEGKIEEIKKLQSQSRIVAMVGDGINDAPSLKQANIGIAIGTGTDIAKEASDITLVKDDLQGVVKAINLSKATFYKIRENIFWAFFYNIIAIPIAALGLLHPVIAEAAMAVSSVNVVTNSLRLKKHKI